MIRDPSSVPPAIARLHARRDIDGLVAATHLRTARTRYLSKSVEGRVAAARALGDLGDTRATSALIDLLGDPVPIIRIAAARALGDLGDRRATAPLVALLPDRYQTPASTYPEEMPYNEPGYPVMMEAIRALGRLGDPEAIYPLTEVIAAGGNEAEEILLRLGDPTVVALALRRRLAEGPPHTLRVVVGLLGRLRDRESIGPIAALMEREGIGAPGYLDQALASIGGPEAKRALERFHDRFGNGTIREAIDHLLRYCREGAWRRVGPWTDRDATQPWQLKAEAMNRAGAVKALGPQARSLAVEHLSGLLSDEHEGVRTTAAIALEVFVGPDVQRALAEAVDA